MHCRILPILLVLTSLSLAHERENHAITTHPEAKLCELTATVHAAWESHYYLEGRDVLDGDSILTQSIELQWDSLAFGVWYGNSSEQHYDELQLSLAWHQKFGQFTEAYIGYTQIRFPHGEGAHDNEIHGGLSYGGGPLGLEFAIDAYHSFGVDGFFVETSASREWELTEKLSTSLTGIIGMNQGYVADGHDGANHLAASWGLSYALTQSLTLGAHATYSWGIDRKAGAADDASLRDFFHAGAGVEWLF